MIGSLQSALSGLLVNQQRVDAAAQNIANATTQGYRKRVVVAQEASGGGVSTRETALPAGDAEASAVDLAEEMPTLGLTQRLYQANLTVVKTQDEMLGSLLDVKD